MVGLILDISKKFNMVHTFQRKFISPPQTSALAAARGKISKTLIQNKCIYLNHTFKAPDLQNEGNDESD